MISRIDHKKQETAEKIHRLFQRSYRIEADLLGQKDFPPLKRRIRNIKQSKSVFSAYWQNGKMLGIIETEGEQGKTHISSLAVDPDFFRKGIAESLLRALLSGKLNDKISVNTAEANIPAIALYQKMGFKIHQQQKSPEGILIVELCFQKC
jgi:ribosomal protein S18 acetylase RimI-like enzyme